jgi:hypothetical protein
LAVLLEEVKVAGALVVAVVLVVLVIQWAMAQVLLV